MMNQQVIQGDCKAVLQTLPNRVSISFDRSAVPRAIKDRSGRSIVNDDNSGSVLSAFSDLYRVLKPNTFCVSSMVGTRLLCSLRRGSVRALQQSDTSCGTRVTHRVAVF